VIGRITTVRALSAHIKELFAYDDALASVWIEGEVTNCRAYSSGHTYFSLVEDNAKLDCVLFRRAAAQQRVLPRDGGRFTLHGNVDSYEGRSSYQLVVDLVQPSGVGLQALELEQLRQKLEAEGLFEPSRKRPLPEFPVAIGVVTSPDGAVWHDIQIVLRRRFPLVELILAPSLVQGPAAPASLIAALQALQDDGRAEVIILARGGGSADDLAAFNDEALARAVFAARVPVVSAVGHESDWSITDEVADVRAPTPSAAAELVSPSIEDLALAVVVLRDRLSRAASAVLRSAQQFVDAEEERLRRWSPAGRRQSQRDQILSLQRRLATAMIRPLADKRHDVATAWTSIERRSEFAMRSRRLDIERNRQLLGALEVHAVMERGFAVLTHRGFDRPISRIKDVETGARVEAFVSDGTIDLTVAARRATAGAQQ
jgi:exodeoxyribonuclease VII large subunit